MKDYKNYHHINTREEILSNGNIMFELMLESSLETNVVTINEIEHQAIIQYKTGDSNTDKRYILIRPNATIVGDYIKVNEDVFLVISKTNTNDVYEQFLIQLCNTSLYIKGERVPIEWDHFGNVIKWSDGEDTVYPCVADKALVYGDGKYNSPINLPDNKIKIIIPLIELKATTFTLYNEEYKVRDLDLTQTYKEKGIITITGERSVKMNE